MRQHLPQLWHSRGSPDALGVETHDQPRGEAIDGFGALDGILKDPRRLPEIIGKSSPIERDLMLRRQFPFFGRAEALRYRYSLLIPNP